MNILYVCFGFNTDKKQFFTKRKDAKQFVKANSGYGIAKVKFLNGVKVFQTEVKS
jgi:hypothetical protein